MKRLYSTLLLIIFADLSYAEDAFNKSNSQDRDKVGITIYNQGVGLVRETRKVNWNKGKLTVWWEDVPALIKPETVQVSGSNANKLQIIEQNYEYDLVSSQKILDKYLGKELTIFRKTSAQSNETPIRAKLLSNAEGRVFQIGETIALDLDGRIEVPEMPDNLYTKPTLVWKVLNEREGSQTVDVAYQTNGMSWNADYILRLDSQEKIGSLQTWVTIANTSGARFENANLQLIAGKINFVRQRENLGIQVSRKEFMPMADSAFQQENISEFYLYTLDFPTDLGSNQTKQIRLFTSESIPVKKLYSFENLPWREEGDNQYNNATIHYSFLNNEMSGLGRPLPAGIFRVFLSDSRGRQQLLGEDSIDHTPDKEEVRIKVGQAFDVVAINRRTQLENFQKGKGERASYRVDFKNKKKEEIQVRYMINHPGESKVIKSSIAFQKESAQRSSAIVTLKAGETLSIDFTIESKFQ